MTRPEGEEEQLAIAFDEQMMANALAESCVELRNLSLLSIEMKKHKPGRRCLIAYHCAPPVGTILGKIRFRGLDLRSFRCQQALFSSGFNHDASDQISVPEALATVPICNMWLQRHVQGQSLLDALLENPDRSAELARRIVDALAKLHRSTVASASAHGVEDEYKLLKKRLRGVTQVRPELAADINGVIDGCERLGSELVEEPGCLIHRDFFHDQVIIDESRVVLVDLDLCCRGPRSLDAGNFIGHLLELEIRQPQSKCLAAFAREFRRAYLSSCPREAASLDAFTTLTLARHISLSTEYPDRSCTTAMLVGALLRRLGADKGRRSPRSSQIRADKTTR